MDWDEIGEGDNPAQNPPELTEHDMFCLNWFGENITGFAVEAGLIPGLLGELSFYPGERPLFHRKISMIYESNRRIAEEEAKKKVKDNG